MIPPWIIKCVTLDVVNTVFLSPCFLSHLYLIMTYSVSDRCALAGGETEGSGAVSDVSIPNEEQRVDADPNQ